VSKEDLEQFPIGWHHRTARKSRQDKPRRASDPDPKIVTQKLPMVATHHGICRLNLHPSSICRSYRHPVGLPQSSKTFIAAIKGNAGSHKIHRHSARHREASAHHFPFWVLRDELSVIDMSPADQ